MRETETRNERLDKDFISALNSLDFVLGVVLERGDNLSGRMISWNRVPRNEGGR